MTKVIIPTPLRKYTNEIGEIDIEGVTIKEIINAIDKKYPGVKNRLCDEQGNIRRYINIYVGGEDIRFLDGIKTKIGDKEVNIVPAIAGG
ncbi:MAG: MoaD/ThiS family protein [Nanoarchaeota archaeon]